MTCVKDAIVGRLDKNKVTNACSVNVWMATKICIWNDLGPRNLIGLPLYHHVTAGGTELNFFENSS